jgi:hypothetical protein
MLNEGGCTILNIISSLQGNSSLFLQAELATYREVFPQVFVFAAMDPSDPLLVQSTLLVAIKSTDKPGNTNEDEVLEEYLNHDATDLVKTGLPVLIDEFAPVDNYTNLAIR